MEYGHHVDAAIMGTGNEAIRTDLASTVFLSDPGSYDGGELVLDMSFGQQKSSWRRVRAIVYSATTLHRVIACHARRPGGGSYLDSERGAG